MVTVTVTVSLFVCTQPASDSGCAGSNSTRCRTWKAAVWLGRRCATSSNHDGIMIAYPSHHDDSQSRVATLPGSHCAWHHRVTDSSSLLSHGACQGGSRGHSGITESSSLLSHGSDDGGTPGPGVYHSASQCDGRARALTAGRRRRPPCQRQT